MTVTSRTKRIASGSSDSESPQGESARPQSERAAEKAPATKGKGKKAPKLMVGLLAVAALIALTVWFLGRGKESTDNAQVEGHVVTVSVRTPGQVAKVLVADNQRVKEGDVLVELDLDELKARLAAAKANRLAAEASLALARAQLDLTQKTTSASIRQARGGVSQAASGVVCGGGRYSKGHRLANKRGT